MSFARGLTHALNLPAPGRRQTLYVVFNFAESCVFSKQSPGPILCDLTWLGTRSPSPSEAPLLPKLRGKFAEFLNEGSHLRLRIFSPPTCVGLRYGHPRGSLEVFLGSVESASSGWPKPSFLVTLGVNDLPDLPRRPTYVTTAHFQPCGSPILLRHPIINTPQPVQEC